MIPTLVTVGRRTLNMAFLIEAEDGETSKGEARLVLRFAAPSPRGVGAADWSVAPYEITLVGDEARDVKRWLWPAPGPQYRPTGYPEGGGS